MSHWPELSSFGGENPMFRREGFSGWGAGNVQWSSCHAASPVCEPEHFQRKWVVV